ncbi:MAG TPA: S9 family peptidase, partial [Myxococcota bacterium]|nr:S9 family peptidase [Myxococcota bacterium]
MSRKAACITLLCLAWLAPESATAAPPFTAAEMMKLKRLADPQLAPDGAAVAYALTEIDLAGATRNADIWLAPLSGGEPRRLTSDKASDTRPRFSPDGKALAFLSTRDGSSQVWRLELAGGEPRKLTSLKTGVDAFEWLGPGRLALVSEVFPECGADDACNAKKLD